MRTYLTIGVLALTYVAGGCERSAPTGAPPIRPAMQNVDPRPTAMKSSKPPQPNESNTNPEPKALSEPPDTYLSLHLALRQFDSTEWHKAIEQLRTKGNQFTLSIIQEIEKSELSQDQLNALDELSATIRKSHSEKLLDKSEVQLLLETAAYADLMCHALENPLRTWTLEFVGGHADLAEIRGELERIRDNYKSQLGTETLFDAMDNRVPFYAKQVLTKFASKE